MVLVLKRDLMVCLWGFWMGKDWFWLKWKCVVF